MNIVREERFHRTLLTRRLTRLTGLALIALGVIGFGYWRVQVVEGAYYRQLADNNRLRKLTIEAPRGWIYDREGRPLAENVPNYALSVDRALSRDLEGSFAFASRLVEIDAEELERRYRDRRSGAGFAPVVVAENLDLETVAHASALQLEHPEIGIEIAHRRLYRPAHQTAHLLGYLSEVSQDDLARAPDAYRPGELIGKKGIERIYDDRLRGIDGARVAVVDSHGRFIEEFDHHPARPGRALRLTIDLELQQVAADLLAEKTGAIVALDPRTGEILAMVSAPSFDPNRFAGRLDPDTWQSLLDDRHKPLQNRAIQNTYPPGSVFKIVMAVAALEDLDINVDETVYCRGFSKIYNHRYRCHKAAGHGWVNLHKAIKYSCNVYFHQLGQRLDIEAIARYARAFGLGAATGLELGGEADGLVPDRQWSLERRGTRWYPGETISVSTGQGPILVTPLQVATMMAAVANGGDLVTPRLVVADAPPARRPLPITLAPRTLDIVRDALTAVVGDTDGTGRAAHLDDLAIAGKTGTAQVVRQVTWTRNDELDPEKRDHAWFASYAPVDRPELVVVVLVEHGGGGSKIAAPLARTLYETHFASRTRPGATR